MKTYYISKIHHIFYFRHNLEEKIKKIETEKIEFVEAQNDLMSKLTALGEEKKAKDEELKEATV